MVDGYFAGTSDRFTVRSPEFFADAYPQTPTVLELEHYAYAPHELRVKLSGAGSPFIQVLGVGGKSWLPGAPVASPYEFSLPADLKPDE
jgi:hypothetical protein